MFGMDLISSLRQRLSTVLIALGISALCCLSGALMTFVFSPAQALQAIHISRLPLMDALDIQSAAPGDTLLLTATLRDNVPPQGKVDLVAYSIEEWRVTQPDDSGRGSQDAKPFGRWQMVETVVPELTMELDGQRVSLHRFAEVRLSGALHEEMVQSNHPLQAMDGDELFPNGTRRYRGLRNGDWVTVLGKKASDDGVNPEQLFEKSQWQADQGLFSAGVCTMALSPLLAIGGLLLAVFRRK